MNTSWWSDVIAADVQYVRWGAFWCPGKSDQTIEELCAIGNHFLYYAFVPTPSAATDPLADLTGSAAEVDRLRVVLLRLARRIRTSAPDTITSSQMSMLGTVLRHGPCTIGHIAEVEHVQPPSASKMVSSLEKHGYVTREVDDTDRRCVNIVITAAGSDLIDEMRAAGRGWLAARLTELDSDEIDALATALPTLEQLLGRYDDGATATDATDKRAAR